MEFEARLATEGFISAVAVDYCGELRKIISGIEVRPVAGADLWPFLRILHVLSLDLNTSTRQTEAHIRSLLAHTVAEGDAVGAADASWNALVTLASNRIPGAYSLRYGELPEELRRRHASVGVNERAVLRALEAHTDLILRGIRSTFGQRLHLTRAALTQKVLSELETTQVVVVSGPAGSGKSAIGKEVVTCLSKDHFTFGALSENL
jgi:hypothetical protein